MNYDPQEVLGGYDALIRQIDDNAAALGVTGLDTAILKAPLVARRALLAADKSACDNLTAALEAATVKFENNGDGSYTMLSDAVDIIAGALGKKSPKGKQILNIRKDITGAAKRYKDTRKRPGSGGGDSSSSPSGSDSSSSVSGSSSSASDSSSSSSGDNSSSSSSSGDSSSSSSNSSSSSSSSS